MNICLDGNGIGNGFGVYILKGKNCPPGSNGGPYEKELLKGLLQGYERQNRQSLFLVRMKKNDIFYSKQNY